MLSNTRTQPEEYDREIKVIPSRIRTYLKEVRETGQYELDFIDGEETFGINVNAPTLAPFVYPAVPDVTRLPDVCSVVAFTQHLERRSN